VALKLSPNLRRTEAQKRKDASSSDGSDLKKSPPKKALLLRLTKAKSQDKDDHRPRSREAGKVVRSKMRREGDWRS
jgi:hypothetical protein